MSINRPNRNNSLQRITGNFTLNGSGGTGSDSRPYGGKRIETFTGSGNFNADVTREWSSSKVIKSVVTGNLAPITSIEYVIIAGGGGASSDSRGGGGGAGGYRTGSTPVSGSYVITVGGGGAAQGLKLGGISGTDSSIGALVVSTGGGGGGAECTFGGSAPPTHTGLPGGSGGGAGGYQVGATGAPGISGQGNNGGNSSPGPKAGFANAGAGGGGAGSAGGNSPGPGAGPGGNGIQLPTTFRDPAGFTGAPGPAGSFYVAGGGVGAYDGRPPFSTGTAGYGGGGGHTTGGTTNTGGGGGGGFYDPGGSEPGHDGGSGIVLIAYPE
jgi:hypothetical protein